MSAFPPESPPPSPCTGAPCQAGPSLPVSIPESQCICGAVSSSLSVNQLADTLGVSPLYKQLDSARWTAARQQYLSSSCHSPNQEQIFSFSDIPEAVSRTARTPLSLEEIATKNRKRHNEDGGVVNGGLGSGGPLELEAIAAVHELGLEVQDMSVSEMLPRTSDLIFVNIKTQEGKVYTTELTMKGWRIASATSDSMNGDYTQIALHTKYYKDARALLDSISPDHATRFNECVAKKLELLTSTC